MKSGSLKIIKYRNGKKVDEKIFYGKKADILYKFLGQGGFMEIVKWIIIFLLIIFTFDRMWEAEDRKSIKSRIINFIEMLISIGLIFIILKI